MARRRSWYEIREERAWRLDHIDFYRSTEVEFAAEVAQNASRLRQRMRCAASGMPFIPPRGDPLQDRDIFQEIQRLVREGASPRLRPRRGAGVIALKTPLYSHQRDARLRLLKREAKTRPTPWIKDVYVPHWDHTGDKLKALSWAMVLKDMEAVAFTIRLGPEVISMARRHRKGFTAFMRDRLQRELRDRFRGCGLPSPEFFLSVEVPHLSELHVHGAIAISREGVPTNNDDDTRFRLFEKLVRSTLDVVAGNWVGPSGRNAGRKVDMPRMETPLRWVSYCMKWMYSSERMLGGPAVAASNAMRDRARRWYTDARLKGFVIDSWKDWKGYGLIDLDDVA